MTRTDADYFYAKMKNGKYGVFKKADGKVERLKNVECTNKGEAARLVYELKHSVPMAQPCSSTVEHPSDKGKVVGASPIGATYE